MDTLTIILFAMICFSHGISRNLNPAACVLKNSGPITVKTDGEIVELLEITTTTTDVGIKVQGKKNVIIRNCHIKHNAQTSWPFGNGITFSDANNITITNVSVELVGHTTGALPNMHNYNIFGTGSKSVRISNVRVTGGSSGIELSDCPDAKVSQFVAINMRGPYPRGQCFQCTDSDNVIVEDFYCKNDNTSWTEDNLSLYRSSNVTVRRGLVDGNNAPNGVGVMFEQDDATKTGGLCEDVDTIHMGDGCFSSYGGTNIRFVRPRCRDNHCVGWSGRAKPSSNSLLFAAGDESGVKSQNIQVEQGEYYNACNSSNIFWEAHQGAWTKKDLAKNDFTPRVPVSVHFCWEQ